MSRRFAFIAAALGVALITVGSGWGLLRAPPERFMGDVQRIMYVHVPTAWIAMLALAFAFACAVLFLWTNDWRWDNLLEAAIEVSVVLSLLLCAQGAIWAKPTWGVWWDWDPRLTTTAVMVCAFGGIVALRASAPDPHKRAVWSAVSCIVAFADVPLVWWSVRWWRSLHQAQSSPETVSPAFWWPLRINAIGILLLCAAFVALRARIAAARLSFELEPAP